MICFFKIESELIKSKWDDGFDRLLSQSITAREGLTKNSSIYKKQASKSIGTQAFKINQKDFH